MLKATILFVSIFTYSFVNSQSNYINYHLLCYQAKVFISEQKYDSANVVFKEAFELVDFIHESNLKTAQRSAQKSKDLEFDTFCQEKLNNINDNINETFKHKIDSIQTLDQKVRTRKHIKARNYLTRCLRDTSYQPKPKKYQRSQEIFEVWRNTDSTNIECFKKLIHQYGYPSEQKVGARSNHLATIVLLHYDKDTANHVMGEILHEALLAGEIPPKDYAWIIDRHLLNAGQKQRYFTIPTILRPLTEEEKRYFNQNRKEIGMDPVENVKIKVKRNAVLISG